MRVAINGSVTAEQELQKAIREGDLDKLQELAPCGCCCDEHFFENCPSRAWGGCRGQCSLTVKDIEEWRKFYGMTQAQFYGLTEDK